MDTQGMISVKAKFQSEIRRFALPASSSWTTLEKTLGSLFSISEPIVVKYLDDEEDLCTISSQEEFNFALAMLKSPLRIHIFLAGEKNVAQTPCLSSSQSAHHSTYQPAYQPAHEHGNFSAEKANPRAERMQNRQTQLEEKRKAIQAALSDDSLNSEKRRVLTWKVQKIEEKIQALESRREKQNERHEKHDRPERHEGKPFSRHGLADQPGHWGRGRGGRGGRGRHCRDQDRSDDLFALTQEARPRIMEARRNGDEAAELAIQKEVLMKLQNQLAVKENPTPESN
jgi:small-conductance mechanosensitive channel